uniref:Uncharacterized protein MANES_06G094000 n=1 Tax=Rhizophora mucronata TaxID=61149 RepID=A0A2P2L6A7_RHIMU
MTIDGEMARGVRNGWSHPKAVVLIWSICIFFYFFILRMAFRHSALHSYPSSSTSSSPPSDFSVTNWEQRSKLYDKMEKELDEHGAAFLKHGETSQSLSLSEIFTIKDGSVTPVLKAAIPPVRANVLYLSPEFSTPISEAVKHIFSSYFNKGKQLLAFLSSEGYLQFCAVTYQWLCQQETIPLAMNKKKNKKAQFMLIFFPILLFFLTCILFSNLVSEL